MTLSPEPWLSLLGRRCLSRALTAGRKTSEVSTRKRLQQVKLQSIKEIYAQRKSESRADRNPRKGTALRPWSRYLKTGLGFQGEREYRSILCFFTSSKEPVIFLSLVLFSKIIHSGNI